MKIILLKDTPKLGKKYEVKEVASGHALNSLIPNGFAEIATPKAIKALDEKRSQNNAQVAVQDQLLAKNFETLGKATITLTEKVNEQGHLFKAVHTDEIIAAVKEQHSIELKEEMIALPEAIKEAGEHAVPLASYDHKATLKLVIEAEK